MRYIYGITDTPFQPQKKTKWIKKTKKLASVYQEPSVLAGRPTFDRDGLPAPFLTTPPPLLELCVSAVDQLPMPSVFKWTDMDVRRWILHYGYPQYMNTFRVNMIWGRKLLLLDANALCAMNIKDFDHIKRIAYGIRMLFHFELTKFSSSVSLPDEKLHELYLLWHTQTGINYDQGRCSDLLRRFQVIRERSPNLGHWDLLEMWLRRERERKHKEIIANTRKVVLYECPKKHLVEDKLDSYICCTCVPPCTCLWTERDRKPSWRLQCLPRTGKRTMDLFNLRGHKCRSIPPCECSWQSKHYLTRTVLTCLKQKFPEKFAPNFSTNPQIEISENMKSIWTRFSL